MGVDFQLILVICALFSGVIWGMDALFFAKHRGKERTLPVTVDYAQSFFPIFILVLVIRSFIVQPFQVPTGSLEPTILPGDFVAVNQFQYGLRLPVLHTKILNISHPRMGDIVVFRFPGNPKVNYIKRVVGLSGDRVEYKNNILFINGKEMKQKFLKESYDMADGINITPVRVLEEDLMGRKHEILLKKSGFSSHDIDVIVPKGHYFMMGDNRDGSADSRFWGFVPEKNLEGKAFLVWFNWTKSLKYRINWSRIGTVL